MIEMTNKPANIPPKLQPWIKARNRYRLSHAHVQMARELGINPKKLGGLANYHQEPWKAPLPEFIEGLYLKRFKKTGPDRVRSIEEMAAESAVKKRKRKSEKDENPGTAVTADVQAG